MAQGEVDAQYVPDGRKFVKKRASIARRRYNRPKAESMGNALGYFCREKNRGTDLG
jgi:hypothetical protein